LSAAYPWDADWDAIDDPAEAEALARELAREVCPQHVLSGKGATAIGRRRHRDSVLFLLDDGKFAQVQLTWNVERDPFWPFTQIYPDFAAWQAVPPEDR
jgi:hypothetical protein